MKGTKFNFVLIFFALSIYACKAQPKTNSSQPLDTSEAHSYQIHSKGNTVAERFPAPKGYKIIAATEGSFASYLRELTLKKDGAPVLLYDGSEKGNQGAHLAVVDLPIGHRNLHQCADAVMRLRAEYLWANKEYNAIHFNFTNGFNAQYSKWKNGSRIRVSGNNVYWVGGAKASTDYASFWKYMEMVFSYAGTLSLSRELKHRNIEDMQIGDVFIYGGSPGHAVIVVNMAEDNRGHRKFMLAQSYMPAQETQILKNPDEPESPWYDLDIGSTLRTPEWTFDADELMHF